MTIVRVHYPIIMHVQWNQEYKQIDAVMDDVS